MANEPTGVDDAEGSLMAVCGALVEAADEEPGTVEAIVVLTRPRGETAPTEGAPIDARRMAATTGTTTL
jgi:hypothetical protein